MKLFLKINYKCMALLVVFLVSFMTLIFYNEALALEDGPGGSTGGEDGPGGSTGGEDGPGPSEGLGCGDGNGVVLCNPLGDKDIIEFLQDILDVIMVFAVPLIIFMIIYAGFLFVMDRGNNKNLEQAKRALLYAVIGGVIILGAQVILEVVQGTVDAFR
jgi:hypothetical protein